ncbi:MAG: DUF2325 domain-containing protein [Candidatus Riflebacteria bacterium]|nr:DUF2325 domain-containing protein [Candidatus Riflebacteria bacterium]
MADDFWSPVFARLHENLFFLKQLCHDTSNTDLQNWVLGNRQLSLRCARFLKKHKVADRNGLIEELISYSEKDQALRKIILFTWVEKNPKPMSFPSLRTDEQTLQKLLQGDFGSPEKISILAQIDPRPGADKIYAKYFAQEKARKQSMEAQDKDTQKDLPTTDDLINPSNAGRIKELERALEVVKSDNKQYKKQLETREREVSAINRKLEEKAELYKEACAKLEKSVKELDVLRRRVTTLENESEKPVQTQQHSKIDSTAELLNEELQLQVSGLQKALQNRDNTIARLEAEKNDLLKERRQDSDKDRKIETLQKNLQELEISQKEIQSKIAGQLLSQVTEDQHKHSWLFLSFSNELYYVPAKLVSASGAVIEEICLLSLDKEAKICALESLEKNTRKEMYGFVKSDSTGFFMIADNCERIPVKGVAGEQMVDSPVRGIYLTETDFREAGIYSLELLKSGEQKDFEKNTVSPKQIKSFFNADLLDFDLFCTELGKLQVSFKIMDNQQIRFSRDYRHILNNLRQHMPVSVFCDAPSCVERAALTILARRSQSGEACSFCGRFPKTDISEELQFNAQQILIFGGDRIGSEYERVLSAHNLLVKWHSGFKNMHELKTGLGKIDAILVIVKQISHTLLREIIPAAEKVGIPVIYCNRRGTSGVLSHLHDFFAGKIVE